MQKITTLANAKFCFFLFLSFCFGASKTIAQNMQTTQASSNLPTFKNNELKFGLNEEGTNYIKFTFLNQVWLRFNENNPGTQIQGNAQDQTFDIGLRRTRIQFLGQMTDRIFLYAQFGQNNFNFNSDRKVGVFFHDLTGEYAIVKKHFTLGAGLMGWNALARYSSPAVGSTMGLDAPIFEQVTNDISDQFVRQLGIFAKGKIGKLDYRVSVAQPFSTQKATSPPPSLLTNKLPNGESAATYSLKVPELSYRGYFMYQFLDSEVNLVPYTTGTYLGKKKVFNIGAGFAYQPNAMWYLGSNGKDTIQTAMQLLTLDVYYDAPLSSKGNALNFYAIFMNNDFGKNYIRNLGVMNVSNGVIANKGTSTGGGNAFAMDGTGNSVYVQAGYKFKNDLLKSQGTLMPYFGMQVADYQAYQDKMLMWHAGINWFIKGHNAKLSLDYQNRPVFNPDSNLNLVEVNRKGMLVLQYQLLF
jgi:hypothetical protein